MNRTSERRTIFPVLEALVSRYRLVLGLPIVAALVTSVVVLLMRPTYAATASFVPESSGPMRLPTDADLLRSREILSAVLSAKVAGPHANDSVVVYDLYRITGSTPERRLDEGIKELRDRLTLGVDQRTDVVRVTVEAPYPSAARDLLQLLLDRLFDFNVQTRQSSAGERRKFIEGRVSFAEEQLRTAEEALRAFYDRNRQWQASLQLRFEEQRLNRQVAVQQELYLTLRREYETARIEEVNNTPVLTVIDRPTIPGRRTKPRRVITVLLVGTVFEVLASALAILLKHHDDLIADGDDEYLRLRRRLAAFWTRDPKFSQHHPTARKETADAAANR